MITIVADEDNLYFGKKLYEGFLDKNIEANYISLENVEVKPCYSCQGCTYKSYGRCIVRDDGDWIFPKIIKSDTLVFVTPITFGSYSFKTKRIFDKCAVIGDRHYKVVKGEITKYGMQGKLKNIYSVGIKDNISQEEKSAFEDLVHENLTIITAHGKSYVIKSESGKETIDVMVEEMSR